MAQFSKKHRDQAMKIICDFHAHRSMEHFISPEYLHYHGIPQNIDVVQLVDVLRSMGYLKIKKDLNGTSFILLTDEGKCYFERKADITHDKRVENIRYIITTLIAVAALITAIVSISLQYQ